MRRSVVAWVAVIAVAAAGLLMVQAATTSEVAGAVVGNPQCPPIAPTPPVTPTPTPTPTPTVAPPTYPKSCTLPWLPGWRPPLGVIFNDPLGSKAAAQAIVRRVIAAVRHTPTGATIRIAVYSFDRSEVAYWLRRARARGVHVQIVVNARVMSGVARRLQKTLGKSPTRSSFLIACQGSCRSKGSGGNLHVKAYTFTRSGGARDLILVSSGNLTSKAVYRQWNDSFGVSQDTGFFDAWVNLFTQLKNQHRVGPRVIGYSSSSTQIGTLLSRVSAAREPAQKAAQKSVQKSVQRPARTTVSPQPEARYHAASDPVVRRMQKVSCTAPAGYGANGHTVIRITMYAMFKSRGEAIARQLARLKRAGCDIRIITSVPGGPTSRILSAAHIPTRNSDWLFTERDPLEEDGIGGFGPRFYSHFKVMALSGTYNGKPVHMIWTGSENWDALSFANDEIVLQVNNTAAYNAYAKRFVQMWNGRPTHRSGLEPSYGP